jgi:hypothetical protein
MARCGGPVSAASEARARLRPLPPSISIGNHGHKFRSHGTQDGTELKVSFAE